MTRSHLVCLSCLHVELYVVKARQMWTLPEFCFWFETECLRYKEPPYNRHCETEIGYRERKGFSIILLKEL